MGAGEKEEAYAMKASRAKAFLGGIIVTLLVLAVLAGSYAALFNEERMRHIFQVKKTMKQSGEQKEATVRLGFEIQKQESEREEQERDTMRSFKRISSVVDRKFNTLLADAQFGLLSPQFKIQIETLKKDILDYVNEELKDFEKERTQYDKESQKRLQRLASMQEQSMRELLRTVSGVKMEALMEMLEEVFTAANKAPAIRATPSMLAQIEELADALYEDKITLEEGHSQFEKLRSGISGDLPEEIAQEMKQAREADVFAEALDSIVEVARLASGKEEIAQIEKKWRKNLENAGEHFQRLADRAEKMIADGKDPLESMATDEEYYDQEVQANVEAILAVHKLVSEGKVPLHLMDFETMELIDTDNDGVPDVEEDDAHKEKEKEQATG
jgi:hypothetical protein